MGTPPARAALPPEIYATLTGAVDGDMVRRVFASGPVAVNGGGKKLRLRIYSAGGTVGDGIALYNYLRKLPQELLSGT